MPSVSTTFSCAAFLACLVLRASSAGAQPVQQVLMLHGSNRGSLVLDSFTGNFRTDLNERTGRPVNVVQIVVGPTGFVGAPEQRWSSTSNRRSPIAASRICI